MGEPSLRANDQRADSRPEVPLEHVPVERVHDQGAACACASDVIRQGGQAPEHAGLGRVGVHHVRLLTQHQPHESQERAQIVDWADPADEVFLPGERDAALDGRCFERRLAGVNSAVGEERLVAASLQTRVQQHDVPRGTANVESRDDAEDLHGIRSGA